MLKDYVVFKQFRGARDGIGWYYTTYDSVTGEGDGWFGSKVVDRNSTDQYEFQFLLIDGKLCSRNRGFQRGCFWSDWY